VSVCTASSEDTDVQSNSASDAHNEEDCNEPKNGRHKVDGLEGNLTARPENTSLASENSKTREIIHELCKKRSDNDSSVAASTDRAKARELRAVEFPGPTTLCLNPDKEARLEGWLSKLPEREASYISHDQAHQEART
jgi:hypothetical protein